jgi:membrane fusion protein, multidrug efflux system
MIATMIQRLVWGFVGMLVILLAAAGCGDSEANRGRLEPAPAPIAVATAPVEERTVPTTLEVTGTLVADARTDVAAELDGRVVEVRVERGSVVAPGAVLARLDDQDATWQVREAEAAEAQTRARLGMMQGAAFDPRETPEARRARAIVERNEAEHQRYARLVESGIVSRSEYEAKRTEAVAAREQYDEALNQMRQLAQGLEAQKARVALARKALADVVVRAPWGGLVADKYVNVGDYVKKGTRVAALVRVDPLRVQLSIPEAAVASVRKGQKVSFLVQAWPDRTFEGTIAYLGPALNPDARALVVEAIVPNGQGLLQPGLFATARVELPGGAATPVVPVAAVRTESGVSRLFVVKDGRAELRFVQLGRQSAGLVEIARGLRPGERVVVSELDRLADGAAVVVADGGR